MTKPPSMIDQRRLRDGAAALEASSREGKTADEIRRQIELIHDGIAALQSLDDLGPEANERAYQDERALWKRLKALEARLTQLKDKGEQ